MLEPLFNKVPVDTGRKLNVHTTFRRRPGRLLNVSCTFNLRLVSTGVASLKPRAYKFIKTKTPARLFSSNFFKSFRTPSGHWYYLFQVNFSMAIPDTTLI